MTATCEDCRVRVQCHVGRQQGHESTGVLTLSLSSGTGDRGIGENLGEGRRLSDRAAVLCLGAHKFSETLPEARREQTVDDRVDSRAEVEEDT